ncbi:unnamed protein product [Knipowitschia caucasica]|uniref:Mini-chromosome maintenance complex-binding protein n=1 Tax=Knipowitschia caucasica TaxID=637954 RepID=A0AAV2JNT6_KNICA
MSGSQEWIHNPLGVVEAMFGDSQNNPDSKWEAKALGFFSEQLKEKEAQTSIPSLNDVPLHYLKPNSLVKFRCMIQDMFDPEFYMGVYETTDPSTKAKVLKCGKYRDVADSGIDFNSDNMVTLERQPFYCVPVPGENAWVKDCYTGSSQVRVLPSTSYAPTRQKRSYEEDEGEAMDTQQTGPQTENYRNGDFKRQETEAPSNHSSTPAPLDLNFPLPGEKGPSCLVKVYEDWEKYKVNDVIEVFGVLSVSPALSALEKEGSSLLDPADAMETVEEQRVHCPPASLVPRLHVLHAKALQHNNPLLPPAPVESNSTFLSSSVADFPSVRAELLTYFTHVLLGDALAAEFLILHLISTVYARRDVLPLGKFTLNLSGVPASYTERLYQIIQQLVPSSYYLPMSLQNMNQMRLVPKKDYTANRLLSGALQLSKNTTLFLDETRLQQGQLDTTGVRNVTALGNLISWQKVDYDFNYHQMEFPCNINVLISSEGRSLLPSDCQVPLRPQLPPSQLDEYLSGLHVPQTNSPQTNRFRSYLSLAQLLPYNISEEMTKWVEDDFVDMRKDDPQSISAEDLHRLLVVARLLAVSEGESALSRESWSKAKHLEALRRSRTEQMTSVNGNEP